MGEMAEYHIDDGLLDEAMYGGGGTRSCRLCAASGLHWGQWRLYDREGLMHRCPVHTLKE